MLLSSVPVAFHRMYGRRERDMERKLPTIYDLYPPDTLLRGTRVGLIRPVSDASGSALQVDIESRPDGLREAAEAQCSPSKRIVLLTTDTGQIDITINLVANLASVGVHHYIVLGSNENTCGLLKGKVACVWSSLMQPYKKKLLEAGTNDVRAFWLIRQIYTGRLAAMGFSPMLLDADVVLFANPFTLIEEHLPQYQAYFLGDTSAGWLSVNGGSLYLREPRADGPIIRVWREFERRVFALLNSTSKFPSQTPHKTKRGWVGKGVPADALLYDQNVLDWSLVGELIGDREYVGRGFVPNARVLTEEERVHVRWAHAPAQRPTPMTFGSPDTARGPFSTQYTLRELRLPGPGLCNASSRIAACDAPETMLKAPPWLFSAESDQYPPPATLPVRHGRRGWSGERVTGRYWATVPPATALVHFVCTRWPGSDGRKVGMRLLRRWHAREIARVLGQSRQAVRSRLTADRRDAMAGAAAAAGAAGRPTLNSPVRLPWWESGRGAQPLIGFKSAIALGDLHRIPAAQCGDEAKCRERWLGRGGATYDREMIGVWHQLLLICAAITGRRPVMPLFECVGLLDARSRNCWVVHPPLHNGSLPASSRWKARGARQASAPPACAFRIGEGCFSALGYPEDLAAVPPSKSVQLQFSADEFLTKGLRSLLIRLLAHAGGAVTRSNSSLHARAVVIDVHELATRISEDDLRSGIAAFTRTNSVRTWKHLARSAMAADTPGVAVPPEQPRRLFENGKPMRAVATAARHGELDGRERGNGRGTRPSGSERPRGSWFSRGRGKRNGMPHGMMQKKAQNVGFNEQSWRLEASSLSCLTFTKPFGQPYVC